MLLSCNLSICRKKEVFMKTQLGLRQNWQQFSLLVLVNAFVGGMVGLERSILPQLALQEFGIASSVAVFSFIVVFGLVKAVSNYYAGHFANQVGRRKLLILGWIFAIPIPFILMWAPSWNWIIAANVLLGLNQGFAWSSTVTMKIDLVGDKNRGLAMGINEFAGYISVGLVAFLTGWIAQNYGIRPYPFYIGIAFVGMGLGLSVFFVHDTQVHVAAAVRESNVPRLKSIFWETTWADRNLGSITQAGLVNNLNDGMVWGLFPMLLLAKGFSLAEIGVITAIYPAVWGLGQLGTGKLSDLICQKDLLVYGLLLQALALVGLIWAVSFSQFAGLSVLLGLGTAMVYPTFLSAIATHTHPLDRAKSLGIFRLWRDSGYAVGALLTGVLSAYFSYSISIASIAGLTVLSAVIVWKRMRCS
jgi:MFS family permease